MDKSPPPLYICIGIKYSRMYLYADYSYRCWLLQYTPPRLPVVRTAAAEAVQTMIRLRQDLMSKCPSVRTAQRSMPISKQQILHRTASITLK